MGSQYSSRPVVPARKTPPLSAVVDTTGMDQSMKDTLLGMRGAAAAGKPASPSGKHPMQGIFAQVARFFGGGK